MAHQNESKNPREKATPGGKPVRELDKGPTHPHEKPDRPDSQKPRDRVDEESMESFPASDPPSH